MTKKENVLLPPGITGPFTDRFNASKALVSDNPEQACKEFLDIVLTPIPETTISDDKENENAMEDTTKNGGEEEDPFRVKEAAIYALGKTQVESGYAEDAKQTFKVIRPFFLTIPKARTAKIVRHFIDLLSNMPNATEVQEQLCLETIAWSREEKRTFLRHRVEARLALLYHQLGRYAQGLGLISDLLKEVKRLDDKLLLVEIHDIEAKLYFNTRNLPKAKAALTAAKSNANSIHCPPLLQADMDILAGAIHLEESDPKTAFSYFFEAFEAFHLAGDPRALSAMKYGMLSKILSGSPQDVSAMTVQGQYVGYAGRSTEAFKAVAVSYLKRDLRKFEETLQEYKEELEKDPVISRHTNRLYQTLLEQNVLKILKPFSRVEVSHVAHLMNLPINRIQAKLSEMILDKQLAGTLDQGAGVLQLFEEEKVPSVYADSLVVFENLSAVVDVLHKNSQTVVL